MKNLKNTLETHIVMTKIILGLSKRDHNGNPANPLWVFL